MEVYTPIEAIEANETTSCEVFSPTFNVIRDTTRALEANTSVVYFTIVGENEQLGNESVYDIAVTMKRNTTIITIRLYLVSITMSAQFVLADALLTNTSIRTLVVEDTYTLYSIECSLMRNRILLVDTMFHPRSILHRLPIELHERIVWLAMEQYIQHDSDQLAVYIRARIANAKRQTRPT